MTPQRPVHHIDPKDPILDSVEAELLALHKRQEQRMVADGKRSWAPTALGTISGLLGGAAVLLHEKYHRLVDVVRSLRHAEMNEGQLAELRESVNGKTPVDKIYGLMRGTKDVPFKKFKKLLGDAPLDEERPINSLFKRYNSPDYIATNERLNAAYKKLDGKPNRAFRRLLDEEVMDKLDSNNIVSLRWRHLSQSDKVRTIALATVSAVAIGAVIYGVAQWLTNETKEDKKRREQDKAMEEDARKYGFAPLTPSAQTKDAADFRERLQKARLVLGSSSPEL